MLVYLLINMVLMLNFVIAIMGNTYSMYAEDMGIYYITVLEQFECMEFDERYGAIACAQQPLNILIIPFAWLYFIIEDDETLKKFNTCLCHLMYFPIAVILSIVFTVFNTLLMPVALMNHLLILTLKIFDTTTSKSTCEKIGTVLKFLLLGSLYLVMALVLDPIKFVYNLYTDKESSIYTTQQSLSITMESFNKFEEVCQEITIE